MAHHKRKKQKRTPYVGYKLARDGEDHSNYKRRTEHELELNKTSRIRKKKKRIVIQAKSKPGKSWWWGRHGWFVWSKYEKMRDAENAISVLRKKRYTGDTYNFRIVDKRKEKIDD